MTLFFDTETNGKANFKAGPSAPGQPMIVQLAAVLFDDAGVEVDSMNTLVKTDGWDIPAEVVKIHGITKTQADADGVTLLTAIERFHEMAAKASLIVAHNVAFDRLIYHVACMKLNILALPHKYYCTMEATTPLCRLPSPWGRGFKWPKLSEAHQILFGEGFEGAHDALADVRACARVYFHINKK